MAKKKGFNWKALGIGICCVAVGAGLTVGVTKAVEHFQNNPPAQEETEEENKTPEETTPGTEENVEDVESTVFSQYANAVESAVG